MANTKSAQKAIRVAARRTVLNKARKDAFKDARKEVLKNAGTTELSTFFKSVDKAAKTGAISKNAASRYKSRVTAKLAK